MKSDDRHIRTFSDITHSAHIAAVKDAHLNYLATSKPLSKLLGFKNSSDLLGLGDYDLNCNASQLAETFQSYDKQIIEHDSTLRLLGFNEYVDGWHLLLTTKKPIKLSEDRDVGVGIETIDISNLGLLNMGVLLNDCLSKKILNKQPVNFSIDSNYDLVGLSRQESFCLFYFIHGYSAKKIAREMSLSVSTIETYLNRVKHKLGCKKRSQLVEKIHHVNLASVLLI